jgi:hypothetical protein
VRVPSTRISDTLLQTRDEQVILTYDAGFLMKGGKTCMNQSAMLQTFKFVIGLLLDQPT